MQMTQNWPQKIRKSIVQVKKSNFHVISTNVLGMDWKLSSTLKNNIFAFEGPHHWGKAFKNCTSCKWVKNDLGNFENGFFWQKSNFHFISNQSRTDFSIIKFSRIINKNKYMIDGKTIVSWLTHPEVQTKASYNCVQGISVVLRFHPSSFPHELDICFPEANESDPQF